MAPRTILDTDIFSELMRDRNAVVRARANAYLMEHGRLTISVITVLEVTKGFTRRAFDPLERFVRGLNLSISWPREGGSRGRIYGDLEPRAAIGGRNHDRGIPTLRDGARTGNDDH